MPGSTNGGRSLALFRGAQNTGRPSGLTIDLLVIVVSLAIIGIFIAID
jgi:hypothetical protein